MFQVHPKKSTIAPQLANVYVDQAFDLNDSAHLLPYIAKA